MDDTDSLFRFDEVLADQDHSHCQSPHDADSADHPLVKLHGI
jgi:hypothetical protein